MVEFGSDEWIKAFMEEINKNEAYALAAKNWEGDFYFVITPEGPIKEPIHLYVDLWHGKCREAFLAKDPSAKDPAFVMSGPLDNWRKVIEKKLDPIQALLTRRFQLKGDMVMVMKNVKAAQELVNCTTRVSTEFPQ